MAKKLDDTVCKAAPDWFIENVSPSSWHIDYYTKLFKYRTAVVRKYRIVNHENIRIMEYNFITGDAGDYTFGYSLKVGIYQDFSFDFSKMEI